MLLIALMALGVQAGDGHPPLLVHFHFKTIALLGATPVYVDIDPVTTTSTHLSWSWRSVLAPRQSFR